MYDVRVRVYISPLCVYIVVKNAVLLTSYVNSQSVLVFWPCMCGEYCHSQLTNSIGKNVIIRENKGRERGKGGGRRERERVK